MPPTVPEERRQAEDVGMLLDDGIVQVWWGGSRQGGTRVTVFGKRVATNQMALLHQPTHAVGLALDERGWMCVLLDGASVLVCSVPLCDRVRPIDLGSRNSNVRWSHARGRNLATRDADAQPQWIPRRGEPV